MCLWSVALKARKAAKWPRTFTMVLTVPLALEAFLILLSISGVSRLLVGILLPLVADWGNPESSIRV